MWRPEYLPGLSFLNNSMGVDSSDSDPETDVNDSDEDFDDVSRESVMIMTTTRVFRVQVASG